VNGRAFRFNNGGRLRLGSKGNVLVAYFAVGTPAAHATVWRLWTPTKLGDVYLGPRFHAGHSKLSIHASGLRLLREKPGSDNVLYDADAYRWQGGARHSPGFERVWRVVTPATELRDARLPDRFKERVVWIAPGGSGTATDFELVLTFGLIVPEGALPYDSPGARCLLRWRLATGETLFILHRTAMVSAEHEKWYADERARAWAEMPEAWQAGARDDTHDHRLHVLSVQREIRFRGCTDLAVDP